MGTPEMNRHLIAIEEHVTGYSACSRELPGCPATGGALEEVEREIDDAIEFLIEGRRLSGYSAPPPRAQSAYREVPA
jgi:predicted RNase H-like HicB family nuclease